MPAARGYNGRLFLESVFDLMGKETASSEEACACGLPFDTKGTPCHVSSRPQRYDHQHTVYLCNIAFNGIQGYSQGHYAVGIVLDGTVNRA